MDFSHDLLKALDAGDTEFYTLTNSNNDFLETVLKALDQDQHDALLEQIAEKLEPTTIDMIAVKIMNTFGPNNYLIVSKLLQKASEKNYPDSLYRLAYMYTMGHGVKENIDKAVKLYEKSINLEFVPAMYKLAEMYHYGIKVNENYSKAVQLYEKAIEYKCTMSMVSLACMYRDNKGVERSYSKAIELLNSAIEMGNIDAIVCLALIYIDRKVIVDNQIIINLLKRAVQYRTARLQLMQFYNDNGMWIDLCQISMEYDEKDYFTLAFEQFYSDEIYDMVKFYDLITDKNFDKMFVNSPPSIIIMLRTNLQKQIEIIDNHFKYAPTAHGSIEAQRHFNEYVKMEY